MPPSWWTCPPIFCATSCSVRPSPLCLTAFISPNVGYGRISVYGYCFPSFPASFCCCYQKVVYRQRWCLPWPHGWLSMGCSWPVGFSGPITGSSAFSMTPVRTTSVPISNGFPFSPTGLSHSGWDADCWHSCLMNTSISGFCHRYRFTFISSFAIWTICCFTNRWKTRWRMAWLLKRKTCVTHTNREQAQRQDTPFSMPK